MVNRTAGILRIGVLQRRRKAPTWGAERRDSSGAPALVDPPKRCPQGRVDRTEHRAPLKLKSLAPVEVAWAYASAHVASFASRYPKTLAATVSLGLAGFAATAFGVAPDVPDAADLPQRTIVESITPVDLRYPARRPRRGRPRSLPHRPDPRERHRRFAARAPQRRRPRCGRVPARRPDREEAPRRSRRQAGPGAGRFARPARRAGGALRRAERGQGADPVHPVAHPAHRRPPGRRHRRSRRSRRSR